MPDNPLQLIPPFRPRANRFGLGIPPSSSLLSPSLLQPPSAHTFSNVGLGNLPGLPFHLNPLLFPPFSSASNQAKDPGEQATLTNVGVTNAAWMAENKRYTSTAEGTFLLPFQSATGAGEGKTWRPSFQLALRNRIGTHSEIGAFTSLGAKVPFGTGKGPTPKATGTKSYGLTYHFGPQAPTEDDGAKWGVGAWFALSQVSGAAPDVAKPPKRWDDNPTLSALLAISKARKDRYGVDIDIGLNASRWGAVNDVTVGGYLNPFLGLNYAFNVGEKDVLNFEGNAGFNLGLSPYAGQPGPQNPGSFAYNLGFGWQHTFDHFVIGVEPYLYGEKWSNMPNVSGNSTLGGGLRLGIGASKYFHRRRAPVVE
jgi:hypothetical protein